MRETAETMDATDAYRVTAKTRIHTPAPRPPTSGATPRKAPPAVATIFPPRLNPRNSGREWPSIAAAPASTPPPWPTSSVATSAGTKPFAVSSSTAGTPSRRP